MTLRAVVFDFDGVIANSEPLHFRAFRDVLAGHELGLSEPEYYARYLGYDDAGLFNAIAADRGRQWSAAELADLMTRKAVRLEELERGRSVLFPGADAAIRRLGALYPLAIASGARRPEIVRVLEREGLGSLFRVLVSAEDTAASKPAPDPYVRAVELLAIATGAPLRPHDCVAVEDSRWGLESAEAAGLLTIAITHSYPAESFSRGQAVISHLDELTPSFLSKLAQNKGG